MENAKKGITSNAKKSFEKSGWIEIVDARLNRSFEKKYPLLNSVLFTKSNPEGEIQGQTLLGKFYTHEYRSTYSGWRPRWGRVRTGPRREQKRSHTAEFIGKKIL